MSKCDTRFNRRNQLAGESAEQYITTLYELVSTCECGGLADQLLRDKLVVGIKDTALSEHLQMDTDLDLEKAKKNNSPKGDSERPPSTTTGW